MIKQPLHSPSIKEIERYILPEETVRAMKTAIAHQKTQIEYFGTIMKAQALFGCVRSTKPEPTPTTRDQTKQQPKQDAAKQEMELMKPILIGGTVLAVIFLAYFFTLILLVA